MPSHGGRGSNQYATKRGAHSQAARAETAVASAAHVDPEQVAWAFHPDHSAWAAAGAATYEEAEPWMAVGYGPQHAEPWIRYGFDFASAEEWKSTLGRNTEVGFVANARDTFGDTATVDQWDAAGFAILTPADCPEIDSAFAWRRRGFTPAEAAHYRSQHLNPLAARAAVGPTPKT